MVTVIIISVKSEILDCIMANMSPICVIFSKNNAYLVYVLLLSRN
jgi:hypothetical protein